MNKLLLGLLFFIFLSFGIYGEEQFQLRGLFDLDAPGKLLADSDDASMNTGFGFGAEVSTRVLNNLELGIGSIFPLGREVKDEDNQVYQTWPVYACGRLYLPVKDLTTYIVSGLGISFPTGSSEFKRAYGNTLENGFYFNLALGAEFNLVENTRSFIEAGYTMDSNKASGLTDNLVYTRFNLKAGLKFLF